MPDIESQRDDEIYWRGWNEAVDACAEMLRIASMDIGYPDAAALLIVHDRMMAERMQERLRHRQS